MFAIQPPLAEFEGRRFAAESSVSDEFLLSSLPWLSSKFVLYISVGEVGV